MADTADMTLAQKASTLYAKSTLTRANVLLIPYVGSALDLIASGAASKYQSARIDKQVRAIEERLQHIEVSRQMELTDELYDLFCTIFETTVKTRHDQKRHYFAEILAKAVEADDSWEEAEQLTRTRPDPH